MRTRTTRKRPSRLSELLLLWFVFQAPGCSLLAFDGLSFDRPPVASLDDGGVLPDGALAADGGVTQDAMEPSPPEEDATVPLPDEGVPGDAAGASGSDADALPPPAPPPPVPPPPVSPCEGATAHRVLMATPVELLGGTCTSIPMSPSVQDSTGIRLVSWTIDLSTCEFTRVREANYGSSGWTSTETGVYTTPRDSEGVQDFVEWGPTPCTRQMRWRWTDLED